jgi:23S rRNA (guanosine2251-2'-O)-methyltransferase
MPGFFDCNGWQDLNRRRPFLKSDSDYKNSASRPEEWRERKILPFIIKTVRLGRDDFTSHPISCTISRMKERPKEKFKEDKIYLYGKHALREALLARPKAIAKVFLDSNAASDKELTDLLAGAGISINSMKDQEAGKKVGDDAVHQGVIAVLAPSNLYTSFDEVVKILDTTKAPCFVLLDELQDPHNVGAIIRSAAAFGASAILLPEHNQSPITGTVIKTSAGMAFRIPIVKIGNVNQTIRLLKEKRMWVYGLVMGGTTILKQSVFDTPTLFVVGNESTGIREKTLELCDVTLSIPMQPGCESLNASVAASVVLYEWSRSQQ